MGSQRNGGIAWTDETWNPVRGCSRVSEGCRNCYAERVATRFSGEGMPYREFARDGRWTGKVELVGDGLGNLSTPLRWKKPRRIFVNSMSDLFHENLPDEAIDQVFAVMALAPQHTFQCLTKRPERMRAYMAGTANGATREVAIATTMDQPTWLSLPRGRSFPRYPSGWPLPNVHLGVSVENQATADERIPLLLQTTAVVRFVSAEPLLDALELADYLHDSDCHLRDEGACTCSEPREAHVDWVIVGGESGPGARPMHPQWARDVRDQCQAAGVPYFFKQWGAWAPCESADWHGLGPAGRPEQRAMSPDGQLVGGFLSNERTERAERDGWVPIQRVGKKRAGRVLDGREWSEFPA